ncbi:MAG: ABC transporter permease [Clostridiales bacterium]|nr:ABC transporter permease [Clostridiales bacterium]
MIDRDGNFGFSNFVSLLNSGTTYRVFGQTILLCALTSLICLVLAYPLALLLVNTKFNRSRTIVLLFIIPMWINFLLRTFALRELLSMIGLGEGYLSVLIGMVYDLFPFMLLPLYTILSGMDKSYKEAGFDLGTTSWQNFCKITLPLSVPGIVSGIMMTFMPALSSFAINDMLGNAQLFLFGNIVNDMYNLNMWGYASALAMIMLLFVGFVMLIGAKFKKSGRLLGGI